jgi:hypothetical protein
MACESLAGFACGPAAAAPEATTPAPGDDHWRGCSCDQLNAQVEVPAAPDELARRERAAVRLASVEEQLAGVLRAEVCAPGAAQAVADILDQRQDALRENRRLDDASCDHVGRCRFERPDRPSLDRLTEAWRSCLDLAAHTEEQLAGLLSVRGCVKLVAPTKPLAAIRCRS